MAKNSNTFFRQKTKLNMVDAIDEITPLLSKSSAVLITQEEEEEEMEGEEKAMLEGDETRKVKFDEILEDLGDFGRYQKLAYFLLFLPTIFSAMQKQSW